MPVANAMAVIVVPPLNRHPETKERPKGSMSSLPPSESTPRTFERPPLPLCTLHPTSDYESLPQDTHLAQSRVPLYNGVSMFPNPEQRAALLELLSRILNLERISRRQRSAAQSDEIPVESSGAEETPRRDDRRASHAFVLISDETTALTADMAGVGMALWRIPMFEGMGWEEKPEWVKRYKYTSMFGNEKYSIL